MTPQPEVGKYYPYISFENIWPFAVKFVFNVRIA